MNKQDQLNELWEKYLADQKLTAGELKQLRTLVQDARHQPQLEQLLTTLYTDKQQMALAADTTAAEAFEEVWARLQTATPSDGEPATIPTLRHRLPWWRYAAAALVIVAAAGSAYQLFRSKTPDAMAQHPTATQTDIQPGGNKALLKLADGSVISLNEAQNGTLAQQGATEVVKLANGQLTYRKTSTPTSDIPKSEISYNLLTTPRGGKYYITLPDGSKVWLNAASSLRYPTAFTGAAREVALTGEAYFEIAPNTAMPFRVKVSEAQVDVLGTHFNIMAYTDEEAMHTTLLEGSVKVSTAAGSRQQLAPGQRASLYYGSNTLKVKNDVDTEEAIAWKNNLIQFAGTDIHAAMRQIARWYDVEVEYKGNIPNAHFRGILPSDAPLAKVLQMMQQTGEAHFEVSGRKIIVMP